MKALVIARINCQDHRQVGRSSKSRSITNPSVSKTENLINGDTYLFNLGGNGIWRSFLALMEFFLLGTDLQKGGWLAVLIRYSI